MKAKNSKERRSSVLKFGVLFIVTIALIVVALFFDFNIVPFKENKVLRDRVASFDKSEKFEKDFSKGMLKIEKLIDSLGNPNKEEDLYYINRSLESEIGDLGATIEKNDTTYRYKMYVSIVNSYRQRKEIASEIYKKDKEFKKLEEYKTAWKEAESKLQRSLSDLDLCRARSN